MTRDELVALPPYKLRTVRDLFDIPPPPMLVDIVLPLHTLTGLTSAPGVGKTWLALELARAVATGTKFLGQFQSRMGNVLFVGQDASVHDYAQQLRKLAQVEFDTYEAEVADGARHINPFDDHIHFLVQSGIVFESQECMRRLAGTILTQRHSETITTEGHETSMGVDLIVFDTLSALTRCDQNDNTTMDMVFRNLRWLTEVTGAGLVLLHHNSYPSDHNNGERWRGAGSQWAALDNWFHINRVSTKRKKDDTGRTEAHRILVKVKRFRGLTPDDFHYTLTVDGTTARLYFDDKPNDTKVTMDPLRVSILGALDITDFRTVEFLTDYLWPVVELTGEMDRVTLAKRVRAALKDEIGITVEVGSLPGVGGFEAYRVKGVPA